MDFGDIKMEILDTEEVNSDESYHPPDSGPDLTSNGVAESPSVEMNDSSSVDGQDDDSNYSDTIDPPAMDDDAVEQELLRTRQLDRNFSPGQHHQCPDPSCHMSFSRKHDVARHFERVHNKGNSQPGHTTQSKSTTDLTSGSNLRINISQRKFTCTVPACGKTFTTTRDINNHQKTTHFTVTADLMTCTICQKGLKSRNHWKDHIRLHEPKPLQCPQCHHYFSEFDHEKHVQNCQGRKIFECDLCDKTFINFLTFKVHKRIHSGEAFKCTHPGCGKKYWTKQGRDRHVESHEKRKEFKCLDSNCSKSFANQPSLTSHLHAKHPQLALAVNPTAQGRVCPVCGVTIVGTARLRQHIQNHSEARPFKCQLCDKAFKKKTNLEGHVSRHGGNRTVPCSFEGCPKLFYRAAEVRLHLRTHTGEKNFLCTICGRASTDAGNLRKHMLIHSDVKQFKCHVCDKAYKQPQMLKTHLKSRK